MDENTPTTPPGWYDDGTGTGTQRYWDGTAWSEATAKADGAVQVGLGGQPDKPKMGKGKKWAIGLGAAFVVFIAIGALSGNGDDSKSPAADKPAKVEKPKVTEKPLTPEEQAAKDAADAAAAQAKAVEDAAKAKAEAEEAAKQAAEEKRQAEKEAAEAKHQAVYDAMTAEQQQAVGAAESYLAYTAFSRLGLIGQLSSDAGDGYSVKDATVAVDWLRVNYKEQAAKAAKQYLDYTHFSRQGLIEQLTSSAGDQYTREQAEYGVTKAGL